jgi:hypothetical protein
MPIVGGGSEHFNMNVLVVRGPRSKYLTRRREATKDSKRFPTSIDGDWILRQSLRRKPLRLLRGYPAKSCFLDKKSRAKTAKLPRAPRKKSNNSVLAFLAPWRSWRITFLVAASGRAEFARLRVKFFIGIKA